MMNRSAWSVALAAAVGTTLLLAVGHQQVGYVRDEGIYFEASRRYAQWVADLGDDPGRGFRRSARDRAFGYNHEHPALMKTVAGLSARWLTSVEGSGDPASTRGAWISEGMAMRLPAQLTAGFGVFLLVLAGARRFGVWAGLLAATYVIAAPHVWFHAGLHAFDVPVAVATLAVALVYSRALRHPGWGVALGPVLGFAIAIKHNALWLGPLLVVHGWSWLWVRRSTDGPQRWGAWVGLPFCSMLVFAPLTVLATWPWLWSDPIGRFRRYLEFHAHHNWYNTEFLGVNYNQPPMPIAYPWVMTFATVPTVLLLLTILGFASMRSAEVDTDGPRVRGDFWRPIPKMTDAVESSLWLVLALFPLLLISHPRTPIFGGTKHWITAYPFFALAAARAWARLWQSCGGRRRWAEPLGWALVLTPSIAATVKGHPYGLSQYAAFVGGPRGAADLGLQRGFWGYAVRPLLPSAQDHTPLYLHDVHPLAQVQYERDGLWPVGLEIGNLGVARSGLLFHERHMLADELRSWDRFGTSAPVDVLELEDVPLTSLYLLEESSTSRTRVRATDP